MTRARPPPTGRVGLNISREWKMWSTCDRMNGNWTIFDKLISYFAAPLHRGHKFVTAVDSVSIIIGEAGFGGVSWCVCWRISYLLIPRIFNRELNLPRKEEKKKQILVTKFLQVLLKISYCLKHQPSPIVLEALPGAPSRDERCLLLGRQF